MLKIKPKSQEGWNDIRWSNIELYVRKLQKRIYSATINGDYKLVRSTQNTLIKSYQARILATRKVTQENKGKNTAGIDGIKSLSPKKRLELAKELKIPSKVKPLRRVWIPKPGKTEKRPLGIPTLSDRALQALQKMALEPEWEAKFEPNSYGFRPGRCCHDAMKQIYLSIFKKPKYVLDADIKKCFDKINHKKLLEKLNYKGKTHKQIKDWLESGVIDNEIFKKTEAGTPQGGVISPLLANIALTGMETLVKKIVTQIPLRYTNGKRAGKIMGVRDRANSISLVRYADDFVILHENKEVILKCKEALEEWLTEIGLELSKEKTCISHTLRGTEEDLNDANFSKTPGFDFLGFTVRQFERKYRGLNGIETIIIPSKEKQMKHLFDIAKILKECRNMSQESFILKLNPIIAGWGMYFGNSDASSEGILKKMDYLLYLKLRKWSKRKTKSSKGGLNKYWKMIGNRKYVFATEIDGKMTELNQYTDFTRSLRNNYVKVKGECSPYDGNEIYWATRLGNSAFMSLTQSSLLKAQKGKCNLCKMYFMDEDILEIDHIIPLSEGGQRSRNNLQLLHRHCHDQKDRYNLIYDLVTPMTRDLS
jgi:RNA-directed DNA polymerase